MASPYSSPVSAHQVGSYFVQQYYQVLQQQPDFAHQFYTDASAMIRVDGDSTESASAMLQIHTVVLSLNFTGIEVKTINSLESWNGGVFVVVSGSVKSKNFSGWRKFVQTFFLAPQEKGYFVLNDIFHFVTEEATYQHPVILPLANQVESQPSTASPPSEPPVSNYLLEVETREFANSVHIEDDDQVEEYSLQEQHQQPDSQTETEEEEEETIVGEESSVPQNAEEELPESVPAVEEFVEEPTKFTYASILRASKGKSLPSVANQPSIPKSVLTGSEWNYTPQPTVQQSNSALSSGPRSSVEVAEEGSSQEDEGQLSKSVYVRNLPLTVSTHDILHEFQKFGRIKPDGVFLKNRKEIGVCFAFVEFEDVQSVQNAIQASPLEWEERQVYVELRRANSSSSSISRGARRGRGSYQNEVGRGRYGARGFGRGGY